MPMGMGIGKQPPAPHSLGSDLQPLSLIPVSSSSSQSGLQLSDQSPTGLGGRWEWLGMREVSLVPQETPRERPLASSRPQRHWE